MNLKFRITRENFYDIGSLGLRFWHRTSTGEVVIPEPIVMKLVKNPDELVIARGPDILLSAESAQQLMDELWHVGLRPSEGSGSAGSLAATQRHLNDMRSIVGKFLKTELPK